MRSVAYEIVDGISRADIAFRVRGSDLNSLFRDGAGALIAIMMGNPDSVRPLVSIVIRCEEDTIELLYHEWLSEIIFYKDSERLLLLPQSIDIVSTGNSYQLHSLCEGETIDRTRHFFSIDIKAVTFHGLMVAEEDAEWTAIAVVDV